ncbi:calcium-binding protein [Williamwhitmania taraxaci]|uniref:Calcium binding n=1 Tax=Williamwhitmania taraxaci TaxID=1640674 RepID=A0A1G6IN92_9BACT|nr:calcium-binding protein [Williamwhitmania taraxaci]SDC07485.1 Calcium binding [Williamwhitmania taraxaci]
MKLGDSVIVNQGIKAPDLEEFEIGGWQGRVVDIDTKSDNDNVLITIEWDSITLLQIPNNYIEQFEQEGLDWENMTLYESELEKTKPRDKKGDVKQTQEKLADIHYWASLGDEGIRISKVLDNVNPNDEMKCMQKWVEYLDNELSFPIHAFVLDSEDDFLIKIGDKVTIKSLPHFVDTYGIVACILLGSKKYYNPLCDLEAIDKTSADFQLIEDYKTWFANR